MRCAGFLDDLQRSQHVLLGEGEHIALDAFKVHVAAFQRGVYFAYVLSRSGRLAVFESGPSGVNGWGFDDIIGTAPFELRSPKAIQANPNDLRGAAWVVHEGPIDPLTGNAGPAGEGAVSHVSIDSAINGQIPLNVSQFFTPQFRSMQLVVDLSVGVEIAGQVAA